MNTKELFVAVNNGFRPIVEFINDEISEFTFLDVGMRARLVKMNEEDNFTWQCYFDQTEFEEYNEPFMQANYYDKGGQPLLNAKEKGVWEMEENFFISDYKEFFKIIENNEIFKMFIADNGCNMNYIQWLEAKVKSCI